MSHEKSITKLQNKPKGGNRAIIYDNSGFNKGDKIGPRWGFKTIKAADAYARARSNSYIEPRTPTKSVRAMPKKKKK